MRRYMIPLGLALFIALFAVFPPPSSGQPERGRARVEEYLNLTPDQKAQLEDFRKTARADRRAHFDQMRKLRTELRQLMKEPEANEKKTESLIDEMGRLRSESLKSRLRNIRKMRKVLTPEQAEKLDRIKARIGRRGTPGRGHPGPGSGLSWRRRPYMGRGAFFPRFRLRWRI